MDFYDYVEQTQKRSQLTYRNNQNFLKKIDKLPTQVTRWTCDIVMFPGNQLTDDGELLPLEKLELWRQDPVECMRELRGNPIFKNSLEYAPQRHYTGITMSLMRCGLETGGGILR